MRTDSIVSHQSSRVRPGEGCRHAELSRSFSLKEKKQRQDENSNSCFLQGTCWGRIAPHRSAKNKAFKLLLRRTQGQKFLELLPAWVKEARGRREVCLLSGGNFWTLTHTPTLQELDCLWRERGILPFMMTDNQHESFVLFNAPQYLAWAFLWKQECHCKVNRPGTGPQHPPLPLLRMPIIFISISKLFHLWCWCSSSCHGRQKSGRKQPTFKTHSATFRRLVFPGPQFH